LLVEVELEEAGVLVVVLEDLEPILDYQYQFHHTQ
jgi:hypothetical protein